MSDNDSSSTTFPFDPEHVVEFTQRAKRLFNLQNKIEEQEEDNLRLQQALLKERRQHERELELVKLTTRRTAKALVGSTLAKVAGAGARAAHSATESEKSPRTSKPISTACHLNSDRRKNR